MVRSVTREVPSRWGKTRTMRGRVLIPSEVHGGYLSVNLGAGVRRSVHTLVLEAFVGPRPEGAVCRHLNGNPKDNRLANLAWGTPGENRRDTVKHGNDPRASKTHCKRGHQYTPENTITKKNGCRECRECRNAYRAQRRRDGVRHDSA